MSFLRASKPTNAQEHTQSAKINTCVEVARMQGVHSETARKTYHGYQQENKNRQNTEELLNLRTDAAFS
eukprot:2880129-Amphidinium_carterae.1